MKFSVVAAVDNELPSSCTVTSPPLAAIVRLSPLGVKVILSPATIVKSSLPLPDPPAVNLRTALSLESCHVWVYVVSV